MNNVRLLILFLVALVTIPAADIRAAQSTTASLQSQSNDGSFTYPYPLPLPPSRGRFQPSLSLAYNSNGGTSTYGEGWSLTTTYIERILPATPTDASGTVGIQYRIVSPFASGLLVRNGTNSAGPGLPNPYRVEVENTYLQFTLSGLQPPVWEAKDAQGNRYVFDKAVDVPGNACPQSCVRWYLSRVEDVDGNVVKYEYRRQGSAAELLLQTISYNAYDPNSSANTGNIGDTGNYATKIDLAYEPETHPVTTASAGSLVSHAERLASVRINNRGSQGWVVLRSYNLRYAQASETEGSVLAEIQEAGLNGASSQASTRFFYNGGIETNTLTLGSGQSIAVPANASDLQPSSLECQLWLGQNTCSIQRLAAWVDIDGDHRPDLVWGGGFKSLRWARNVTLIGAKTPTFIPIRTLPGSESFPGIVT